MHQHKSYQLFNTQQSHDVCDLEVCLQLSDARFAVRLSVVRDVVLSVVN